jgi:predicted DNA-binding WGR domain protein
VVERAAGLKSLAREGRRAIPIKHHLALHRIDPEQGIRRFYSLMIERDLFGTVRPVRNWGRIGTNGREMVELFPNELEAGEALEAVARAKRRRGIGICETRGRPSASRRDTSGSAVQRLLWRAGGGGH